jgi:hypothetical protein
VRAMTAPPTVRELLAGYTKASSAGEYHGVQFRSQLEIDFARHLHLMGSEWTYEPRVYGPKGRRYLPDFVVDAPSRRTFFEVKPTRAMAERAKERMAVIWDEEPDAVLVVVCAEGSTFSAAERGSPWHTWIERWKHA